MAAAVPREGALWVHFRYPSRIHRTVVVKGLEGAQHLACLGVESAWVQRCSIVGLVVQGVHMFVVVVEDDPTVSPESRRQRTFRGRSSVS